jgi:hypothetical protein
MEKNTKLEPLDIRFELYRLYNEYYETNFFDYDKKSQEPWTVTNYEKIQKINDEYYHGYMLEEILRFVEYIQELDKFYNRVEGREAYLSSKPVDTKVVSVNLSGVEKNVKCVTLLKFYQMMLKRIGHLAVENGYKRISDKDNWKYKECKFFGSVYKEFIPIKEYLSDKIDYIVENQMIFGYVDDQESYEKAYAHYNNKNQVHPKNIKMLVRK